jgi:ABC-type uncharacterized transport system ATPase subunit
VEYTCDHVVVLHHARVATQGAISALKGPRGSVFELRIKGNRAAFAETLRAEGFTAHDGDEDVMRVFVPDERGAQAVFAVAARDAVQVRHLRPSVPTLEDVFAQAVGEE